MNSDDARDYLAKVGQRGMKTLQIVEALAPFVEAMQSDIGEQLLKDDIEKHSNLINKIYNSLIMEGSAEQKDVIELKIRHDRLQTIYDKIKQYYISSEMIKKVKDNG